jgi:hypothetical protein
VRSIDITGVKALKVSFEEQFGYNDAFVTKYNRALYAGESTSDLDGGTFDPANWTTVMAFDDTRWAGTSTWASRVPSSVDDVLVDLSSVTGNTLKLSWFIGVISAAQNGQYIIDSCNAQVSLAFEAEEQ